LRRVVRTFLGYFVWKITILRQKILFFSNFRGPPPWSAPVSHRSTNRAKEDIYLSS
jgi:hypothetical protein